MNAGFEDCSVLNELLNKNADQIPITLQEYTNLRVKSAYAISDLAMYNYVEMRDLCDRKSFKIRKMCDNQLYKLFPTKWIPLYSSVTYSSITYEKCLENKQWQDQVSNVNLIKVVLEYIQNKASKINTNKSKIQKRYLQKKLENWFKKNLTRCNNYDRKSLLISKYVKS